MHIIKASASGKIWLEPVAQVAYLYGFTHSEQKDIFKIIESHSEEFKNKWHEYFSK